ncbi:MULTISPECIES: NAD-dependent epimerase/dehydratase family protein [Paenibacillus]|uniref:NAD-dependent epimerase/dehydratase family protein n=1 Tax=Paenibacillus TaxID=44249 RepID=UPI0006D115B1|nr:MULTISPECIES: NAD-dependent epimerase/dehydratase family protein [Paenibacillus]GCL71631.1 NAD-dependent dehydratase [Paenibacillus naphthalenovorans]
MNILVTGGAGFIGSHLVERLIAAGHRLWTLDDMSAGQSGFLDKAAESGQHTMVHGSVTDKDLLRELMRHCDTVFHLAAVLGVKNTVENPLKVIEGNIDGTRNVLELAHEKKMKVVFASTSEIYGKNDNLPFREDSDRVLGSPSIHRWCYATAKAIDEHLCFAYAEMGLPVAVVRYFNAYGPRQVSSQYGGVVPRFIKAALTNSPIKVYGDGKQTRCFTYVGDTVAGTIAAMDSKADGLAFNLGSANPISILDLAHKIRDLAGSSSPILFESYEKAYGVGYEDMRARIPDLTRSKRILRYEPTVTLDEGLRLTIDWYRQQQDKAVNGT